MPAKYKSNAKTPREEVNESDVYNALVEVVEGRMSLRKAALQKNVKKSTLANRLQKIRNKHKTDTVTLALLNTAFDNL